MSQENVEVVRRIYEAAACRDAPAVLALYDHGVCYQSVLEARNPSPSRDSVKGERPDSNPRPPGRTTRRMGVT